MALGLNPSFGSLAVLDFRLPVVLENQAGSE
jgi:hypothetical protein